ncbi:MAG TPA: hypothetical protein VFN57_16670 [Thermomicrobiaceae bacterium]|nr:hypothetical protein [Thermomicrobiaceae bacterium]
METFFLACFVFGALFTVASAVLGFLGVGARLPHGAHVSDGGHELPLPHLEHGLHLGHDAQAGHGPAAHEAPAAAQLHAPASHLPLLNLSSLLAFLTWFGAAGYLVLHVGGAPLLLALPVAVVVGAIGGLLIARFLGAVMAGEREMNPADYVLEGTLARVTVSIPAGGVGEVVFSKAGIRRSEGARSASGHAIPRATEVVILDYARGVAVVQPWNEPLERVPPEIPEECTPPADVADE